MTNKETIIDLYRNENQAMVDKDIDTLDEILAPSMHLRHMTGYNQPKSEWLRQIQTGEMKYFSSIEENIRDVRINGSDASLTGQNRVKASVWGSSIATWPLQMKMEFKKAQGRWIITNQQASMY